MQGASSVLLVQEMLFIILTSYTTFNVLLGHTLLHKTLEPNRPRHLDEKTTGKTCQFLCVVSISSSSVISTFSN